MDYTQLYSTRIQKTFDEDQADILAILQTQLKKNPKFDLELINYYKGMPISYKATIASIEKGALDLDINPHQAVAISTEHYTFIRSKLFKYDVLAKAQYVSAKHKAASLRQLCYVEILAERRNHIRLELTPAINAIYLSSNGTVKGNLVELSMAGTIMTLDQSLETEAGEDSKLLFNLLDPEQGTTYNIKEAAKLVAIKDDTKPVQHRFQLIPDKITDRQISRFLFQRQVEIIRELKDLSEV